MNSFHNRVEFGTNFWRAFGISEGVLNTPNPHRYATVRKQRNEMIKKLKKKNTGGNWPTTNETLVNNYLQIFVKLVKSIDLQICNDA